MPRRPTLTEVARRAGVSLAAASYVLNGREGRVAPAAGPRTVELVRKAATDLGYVPNQSARNLRRQRTEQALVLVPRLDMPWADLLVDRLQEEADRHHYSVLAVPVNTEKRLQHVLELLRRGVADGVVITAMPDAFEDADLADLESRGVRVLAFSDHLHLHDFDVVRSHEYDACRSALDRLLEKGRRRVAFLGEAHAVHRAHISEPYRAYRDAVTSWGLECDPDLVVTGAEDRVAAYRSAMRLIATGNRPDLVFSVSDRGAISVLHALGDAGVRVPDEVAVLGFGNAPEGEIVRPALSTVGPIWGGMEEVARQLFGRLLDGTVSPREIDSPVRVIWRQST